MIRSPSDKAGAAVVIMQTALQDLGSPTWTSALVDRIRKKGPGRATAGQWLRFVLAGSEQGISLDEIKFSHIDLILTSRHIETDVLTRQQVLSEIAMGPLHPRLQLTVEDSFKPSDNWGETASLIPAAQHRKRRLLGTWPESRYVIRYRHRSLGWSIALARHSDLFVPGDRSWVVLDPRGARAVDQPPYGFSCARDAMAHAATRLLRQFTRSGKARHAPRWERFSLAGLDAYTELLVTLPNWSGNFESRAHFPGVRNLLIHLRTNVCNANDGRRVLFLDEVQSDWHAMLAKQDKLDRFLDDYSPVGAPFARDWPLLAMKFALWWAARQGLDGVAWSTPDLHLQRWRNYNPPTEVYRNGLPQAAAKLARVLSLQVSTATLLRRRVRSVDGRRWEVLSKQGSPACRAFDTQEKASRFADLIGAVWQPVLPVVWITESLPFDRMPLFGVGDASLWTSSDPRPEKQCVGGRGHA